MTLVGNAEFPVYPMTTQNAAYNASQHATSFQQPPVTSFPSDMFR